jgi:hypothetical protein
MAMPNTTTAQLEMTEMLNFYIMLLLPQFKEEKK